MEDHFLRTYAIVWDKCLGEICARKDYTTRNQLDTVRAATSNWSHRENVKWHKKGSNTFCYCFLQKRVLITILQCLFQEHSYYFLLDCLLILSPLFQPCVIFQASGETLMIEENPICVRSEGEKMRNTGSKIWKWEKALKVPRCGVWRGAGWK